MADMMIQDKVDEGRLAKTDESQDGFMKSDGNV